MRRTATALLGLFTGLMLAGAATADDKYPSKPVVMTITFNPGGAADISGRMAAAIAEKALGQPISVVNKLGGGGAVGFDYVGSQAPDGHNIGWLSASILTTTLFKQLPYTFEHFEYVCGITFEATAIAVRNDAPWKTLPEFLAEAKAKPGQIKVGDAGAGSFTFLTAAALFAKQSVNAAIVPVGARRVPALLSREVHAISVHPSEVMPSVRNSEIRLLALSSPERVATFPDVPTFGELGMELGFYQFRGVFVPKGTPQAVKVALDKAFRKAAEDTGYQDAAKQRGFAVKYIGLNDFPAYVAKQNSLLKSVIEAMPKETK